jgi:hypothetical protein
MAEQTTARVLDRPTPSRQSAERQPSKVDRLWQTCNETVRDRLNEARAYIDAKGDKVDNASIVRVARNLQYEHMAKMNPDDASVRDVTAGRLALALFQVPAAAQAQREAEAFKGPRRERPQIPQLIHFGDYLGDAAEYMEPEMVRELPDRFFLLKQHVLGRSLGQDAVFTRQEYDRDIIPGIAREVAFQKALRDTLPAGYDVRNSTLVENQNGVDKIVSDDIGHEIGIDVKANDSYMEAVEKTWSGHQMTDDEHDQAKEDGYMYPRAIARRDQDQLRIIVNADTIGDLDLETWTYTNPEAVSEFAVAQLEAVRGRRLRKIGFSAIK